MDSDSSLKLTVKLDKVLSRDQPGGPLKQLGGL